MKTSGVKSWIRLAAFILAAVVFAGSGPAMAEEDGEQSLDKSLEGIKFGVLAYLDYSEGQSPLPDGEEENYNLFSLTRGYLTVKKQMTGWLGMRLSMDIKHETKDPGSKLQGSYVVRMKYFYAELKPEDMGPFTGMKSEIGLGHIPWLDFEEHINPYRCQGTMAIERAHVTNSADLGASIRGNLGGSLEGAEEKTGAHHYNGRYGGWHIGVYNGGGYHSIEENQNKVMEGRISLRPLPDLVPGLKFSYFGAYGDGNVAGDEVLSVATGDTVALDEAPDYEVHLGMVSFQHPWVILTGQYFQTRGNQSGEWVDREGDALVTEGYSMFLNLTVPGTNMKGNLFGRYDWFDIDPKDEWGDETAFTTIIAGGAWEVYHGNMLLLVWESTDYEEDANVKGKLPVPGLDLGDEEKIQAVWQIKF